MKPPNHSQRQLNLPRACYIWKKIKGGGKKMTVSLEYLLKSISKDFPLQSPAAHRESILFYFISLAR